LLLAFVGSKATHHGFYFYQLILSHAFSLLPEGFVPAPANWKSILNPTHVFLLRAQICIDLIAQGFRKDSLTFDCFIARFDSDGDNKSKRSQACRHALAVQLISTNGSTISMIYAGLFWLDRWAKNFPDLSRKWAVRSICPELVSRALIFIERQKRYKKAVFRIFSVFFRLWGARWSSKLGTAHT